jgi:hypothetical protein
MRGKQKVNMESNSFNFPNMIVVYKLTHKKGENNA